MYAHPFQLRCFDKRIEKEVPESRCDPYLKPRPVESCRVYCPGECVVSDWSISKKCTEVSRLSYPNRPQRIFQLKNVGVIIVKLRFIENDD